MFDIRRSDLVLACFLGANCVSIGAVAEIFWAYALSKPVLIVREKDNVHNHDMLNELAGWIFEDLDAAIEQIRRLLRTMA
jgi:nucleoside 2-deoxyribosyltransferase